MTEVTVAAKGLDGVVVGDTVLSRVDGEIGELIYRGYDIDEVADCTFEQVAYLFLYGELPSPEAEKIFKANLQKRYAIPNDVRDFICRNAKIDHPMATLRTAVSMLSAHVSQEDLIETALELIAKTGTIAATICRVRQSKDPLAPNISFGFSKILFICALAIFQTI